MIFLFLPLVKRLFRLSRSFRQSVLVCSTNLCILPRSKGLILSRVRRKASILCFSRTLPKFSMRDISAFASSTFPSLYSSPRSPEKKRPGTTTSMGLSSPLSPITMVSAPRAIMVAAPCALWGTITLKKSNISRIIPTIGHGTVVSPRWAKRNRSRGFPPRGFSSESSRYISPTASWLMLPSALGRSQRI